MSFFGCPNVYFYGFDKYYYIVPQMKHKKKKKKILNLLKHYELILQLWKSYTKTINIQLMMDFSPQVCLGFPPT